MRLYYCEMKDLFNFDIERAIESIDRSLRFYRRNFLGVHLTQTELNKNIAGIRNEYDNMYYFNRNELNELSSVYCKIKNHGLYVNHNKKYLNKKTEKLEPVVEYDLEITDVLPTLDTIKETIEYYNTIFVKRTEEELERMSNYDYKSEVLKLWFWHIPYVSQYIELAKSILENGEDLILSKENIDKWFCDNKISLRFANFLKKANKEYAISNEVYKERLNNLNNKIENYKNKRENERKQVLDFLNGILEHYA